MYKDGKGKDFMNKNFIGMAFLQVETEQCKEYLLDKYAEQSSLMCQGK